AFDSELRRPVERAARADEAFQDRARVVQRKANPEREDERQMPELLNPIAAELALRVREVEEDRAGRGQEEHGVGDREEEALALVAGEDNRVDDDREEQEEHV